MKRIIKDWKTTVLGIVVTLAAVFSVFYVESVTWTDASLGICIGILLAFSPDTLISKIESFLKIKSNESKNTMDTHSDNESNNNSSSTTEELPKE